MSTGEAFRRGPKAKKRKCRGRGCENEFAPLRRRHVYCSSKCRTESWWRKHPRQPANPKRPRSTRKHHGAEFQLTLEEVLYIAYVQEIERLPNGSAALRLILEDDMERRRKP